MRRTAEYLSNLQYLGFIIKKENEFLLTNNGKKLALAKEYSDYIAILSNAFMLLKIGNEFDIKGFYSAYNNHILFQCLRIINDLEKNDMIATMEHLAFAIMCKDEEKEYAKALNICLSYDYKEIQNIWFSRGREFNRAIRGVFLRWLYQVKLVDLEGRDGTIFVKLTEFGRNIYNNYKNKYLAIAEGIQDVEDIKQILERSIDNQYLRLSISAESNNRAGANWEATVKENLNKLDLNVDWYKKSLNFINVELPSDVIMSLTGGTRYNPDLILDDPLWLIDPKKDANNEMHKVVAYDKYALMVNGIAIIVTQKIMKDDKVNIMKNLKLEKVLILDGYALQVLADNNNYFSKDKVISIIEKTNECREYYINEELIFDEFVK